MELEHLTLNRVIGLTSLSNASFIASPDGSIFYAAGCVCISYNPQTNKQAGFFTVGRAISCMHLSGDGKYLAIGERGHLPCVTVWDVKKQKQIRSYTGHQHGISSVQFSPNGKYLVSIGFKHDKQMMLHEWEIDRLVCVEKMENKVNALSFHASGDFFVTCGDRHLKWWYLVFNDSDDKNLVSGLNGRPASILKAQQDSNFVDVVCCPKNAGGGETSNIFCTTSSGMLCLIHEKRLMDKWVQLDSSASYCLTLTPSFVIVGGASGDVFVFNPSSLEFITTLPRSAPLCMSDKSSSDTLEFAACYGITMIPSTTCVAAMYADRSIFIWDIADIHNPIKFKSFVFHKACIWDLVFIEQTAKNESVKDLISDKPDSDILSTSAKVDEHSLPSGTFATCGADNSICLWNLDPKMQRRSKWKSPYSRDLLHSFQLDGPVCSREAEVGSFPDIELPDRQQGNYIARALAVHPNGNELACGDKQGKLYIYDLSTMMSMTSHKSAEASATASGTGFNAHEAEVLTLNYSPYFHGSAVMPSLDVGDDTQENLVLLASAGRDRLIHVFDATENINDGNSSDHDTSKERYSHVGTLDSHSSSVTVVKFTLDGKSLISCGGDKTMVLHSVTDKKVARKKSIQTPNGTINGLTLDIATNKYAVSTGQDKRVNVWNLASGKLLRSYRPHGLGGEMYKCSMDPSGTFVATCSFDKVIRVFDFFSGEIVAQAFGHSDMITGVKFSPDGKYLLSIGGDGCIMAWSLSQAMVEEMEDRLLELFTQAEKKAAKVKEKARLVATGEVKEPLSIKGPTPPCISTSSATDSQQSLAAEEKRKPLGVTRERKAIRTGGMGSLVESNSESEVSARPSTSAGAINTQSSNRALTPEEPPTRPTTAPDKHSLQAQPQGEHASADRGKLFGGKRPSAPAWALRKADASDRAINNNKDSSNNSNASISESKTPSAVPAPKSRWAARSESSQLQILGKAVSRGKGGDRHKLTLEMTVEEDTWKAPVPSSPSMLAKTLEDSDEVLLDSDSNSGGSDDDDEEVMGGGVDKDGDSDDEVKLNKTSSQLDELEESALKLETWLEKKLREDIALDEGFSSSLDDKNKATISDKAECKVIKHPSERQSKFSSSGKAVLGHSLSSTFFRNVNKHPTPPQNPPVHTAASSGGDDLPPPPASTSSVSRTSSEAMFQKRQDTACAVAQMRERLRQMGILEKSGKIIKSAVSKSHEELFSPSPETTPKVNDEVNIDTVTTCEQKLAQFEDDGAIKHEVFVPPLPPPAFVDDSSDKGGNGAGEGVDEEDTASTVSGGSEVHNDNSDEHALENKYDDEIVADIDAEEEEAMRLLLKNLEEAREKAMSAYITLVSKKNAALSESSATIIQESSSLYHEESSSAASSTSQTLAPPTVCASSPMSHKRANKEWIEGKEVVSSLDCLLSDFEHSFETMTKTASDALTKSASGMYRSATLSKWQQIGGPGTGSRSVLTLPTVSETLENRLDTSSAIDEFVTPRSSQIFANHNSLNSSLLSSSAQENSNSNIEAILEKYSDRLASMVSAKVFSASVSSLQQHKDTDGV